MQTQTNYIGTPQDLEAALTRVIAPLVERLRELELTAGSAKHLYTTREAGLRIGYSADMIRRFIRDGKENRKGKKIYLSAKEITLGDYRISPADLERFISYF